MSLGWSVARVFPKGIAEQYAGFAWKGYVEANPLHAIRKLRRLSQQKLADLLGVSQSAVNHWEWAGIPEHGVDVLLSRIGIDLGEANEQWRADKPPGAIALRNDGRGHIWQSKYAPIGHATIAVETEQTRVLKERRQWLLRQAIHRRDERELARLYRGFERRQNRQAVIAVRTQLERQQREREERIIKAINTDEREAAKWLEEYQNEIPELKNDWHLYFSLPMEGDETHDLPSKLVEARATLNVVDACGNMWLEDAVIAKIDKEREGYFVDLSYNGRSHAVRLLNDDGFLPARDLERPLRS